MLLARFAPQEGDEPSRERETKTRGETAPSVARPAAPGPADESSLPAVRTPGRGGEHHKYLQQLIKRWAEARGHVVTIEKPILDGLGSVDVALEKEDHLVACKISVTTQAEHETGNVQKCLEAGFHDVILVSSERRY